MKYIHKSKIPQFIVEKMKNKSSIHPSVLGSGCSIDLYHIDYQNFYDIIHGFMYGLIQQPQFESVTCVVCDYMGDAIGNIQESVIALEATRNIWLVNQDKIMNSPFWSKVSILLFIYLMLVSVMVNIDKIWKYGPLQ